MKRWPPLHPFFLALVPVFALYEPRIGATSLAEILEVAGVAVAVAAVTLAPGLALFRNARKAAVLATVALAGGLHYMRLLDLVEQTPIVGPGLAHHRFAIPFYLLAVAGTAWWLRRTRRPLDIATALANVVTLGMLLLPGARLGWFFAAHSVPAWDPAAAVAADPGLAGAVRPAQPPDIWYIILDRYAGESTLREVFDLEEQEFYDQLAARGFFIARRSHSNYLHTAHSLASSLNFGYLDELAEQNGADSNDARPLHERVRRHKAGAFLRSMGYRHIHAGSWWRPTRRDPLADENIVYPALPHGALVLVDLTILAPLRWKLDLPWIDDRLQQYIHVEYELARLAELPRQPGPKFVFAHFLTPHEPYFFRADGSYRSSLEVETMSPEQLYRDQVLGTNRFVLALIDRILADSHAPPVILLQSDEGPWFPELVRREHEFDWRSASPAQLRQKTVILSAYLLPGFDTGALDQGITPVNSFRIVFNHYFGARLEILPNRVFAHQGDHWPYRFFDVGHKLEDR